MIWTQYTIFVILPIWADFFAFSLPPSADSAYINIRRDGAVVRAITSHQCIPGSIPGPGVITWVEFVVGSLPCSERFFSVYSSFPLSSKTNISKFQFDLDYCQALIVSLWLRWSRKHSLCLTLNLYFYIYIISTNGKQLLKQPKANTDLLHFSSFEFS